MRSRPFHNKFTLSALTAGGAFFTEERFLAWFRDKSVAGTYAVDQIPFSGLQSWRFSPETGDLSHDSGKFFTVHGISIHTSYPEVQHWEQPIIYQPEIGILGILTKTFGGVPHFLMQAKMEPGNVNMVQLSPTLQATRSNFTQVHQGRLPLYFEYFSDRARGHTIVDQLQSEQGARYFNKRNRNMIVAVEDEIEVHEDFCWLTLGQIKKLLRFDNLVNMDSRTVLAGVQFWDWENPDSSAQGSPLEPAGVRLEGFPADLYASLTARDNTAHSFDELISWLTHLKSNCEVLVKRIPLNAVRHWIRDDREIRHESGHYFSVIAVRAQAHNREVSQWTQPLLRHFSHGLVGFLAAKINGVLHFLVEARMCPGYMDLIEMGPTVSCSEADYRRGANRTPPFFEYFYGADEKAVRFSAVLSEEGGRFYHYQNRYMIVELENPDAIRVPFNYIWMSLGHLMKFIKHTNYINVEARTLIACLTFIDPADGSS